MLRITKPTYDDDEAGILPISDVHNLLEVEGDQTEYLFEYLTERRRELEARDLEPPSRFANFSGILKRIAEETSWHIGLLNPTAQDKHIYTYYPVTPKQSKRQGRFIFTRSLPKGNVESSHFDEEYTYIC